MPGVSAGKPVDYGLVIGLGHLGVAEHAVLGAPCHGIDDGLGHAEVHVGHPHRDGVLGLGGVPFHAVRAASLYRLVEVMSHGRGFSRVMISQSAGPLMFLSMMISP